MQFHRYHALGNDYLVIDPADHPAPLTAAQIERLCHRHFGIGADGILWGPLPGRDGAPFALRIWNPDGSEAEKSGNGLRIFCRYLFDTGRVVLEAPFRVHTPGGVVDATVHAGGGEVTVVMGRVSFLSCDIPVTGPRREVLDEPLEVGGRTLRVSAATLGNPHCVVDWPEAGEAEARQFGPLIETDARFPQRTNVQFLRVIDRTRIAIQIWERGAGYTLASGSSACAAAAVAHRLGRVDERLRVLTPGGALFVAIGENWTVTLRGPVTRVASGVIDPEMFRIG
ncbi:MAG: diaminopimelate epimerase [Casimicrobiaceae bacterium]|nr:diaminopimelate epimerase [Casimicrobiaceae bacterium]MCX8098318.1 diaminopimelate epimerase [Casimicrobiaceae bacterium]MDW8311746.1 diaminopimelate epimerase [Burkholderiales bacterium]